MSHVIKLLFTTILHCTYLTSPMLTAQEATLVVPAGEDVAAAVPSSSSDSELLSVEDVVRRSEELAQSNRSFRVRCQLRSATMSQGKFTSTYAMFWTGAMGQELAVRIKIDKKTQSELHQRRIFDLTAAMENTDVELEGHVEMEGRMTKMAVLIIKDLKHVHSPLPQITGNEPAQQKAALEFLLQKLKSTIHSYDRFHIQYDLERSMFELEQNEAGFKNQATDSSQSTQLEVKGPTSKAVTKTTVLKEEIQSAPRHWFSFEQRFDNDGMRNAWVQSLATAEGVSSRTNRNPQPTVPADFDLVNRKESLGTLTFNLLERNAGQRGGKPGPEISLIDYFRSDQGDVRLDWTEDGVRVSKTTELDQSGFSKWEVTFSRDHDWHPVRVAKLFSEVDGHQGQFLADGHQRQFLAEWRATELEMVDGLARVKSGELICPVALPTRNGSDLMLSKSIFRIRKATYGDAVTAKLDWHAVPESPTLDEEVATQLQEPQQPGLTAPNVNSTLGSATRAMPSMTAEPPAIFEPPMVPIAEYRRRLSELELPLLQLAEKVRSTEASVGKDHADSAKLRADLRALVQQTFAARQEIQRAELAEFTRRLQRMQQSIDARDRIADKIVERRIEELLDPNVKWTQDRSSIESAGAHIPGLEDSLQGNAKLLARLQGIWVVERLNVGMEDGWQEKIADPDEITIADRLISFNRDGSPMLFSLKPPGVPQAIDVTVDPNGEAFRTFGLIDCDGDRLRLCIRAPVGPDEVLDEADRPTVFVPGTKVVIYECRRKLPSRASATPDSSGYSDPDIIVTEIPRETVILQLVGARFRSALKANVLNGTEWKQGVQIDSLEPDGPAAVAGLKVDDIVVAIDKNLVGTLDDINRAWQDTHPFGAPSTIAFVRDGVESWATLKWSHPLLLSGRGTVSGLVQSVSGTEVQITLGVADGVQPGDRFTVLSGLAADNVVEITVVQQDRSVARIVKESEKFRISVGDQVVPDASHSSIRVHLKSDRSFEMPWDGAITRTPTAAEFEIPADNTSELQLSKFQGTDDLRFCITVEPRYSNLEALQFLQHNVMVIEVKDADIAQLQEGKMVIKVLYVTPGSSGVSAISGISKIADSDVDAGTDPAVIAAGHGTVIGVVRMSRIDPLSDESVSE